MTCLRVKNLNHFTMFSDDSQAEWREPRKNYGNYPKRPQKSYLHSYSILSLPLSLQVKKVSHYFPSLTFWSQCMAIFSGDIFLTFLDLTLSRQTPFLVFERVSTNTKNQVSFWALSFRQKSSLFLGPSFLPSWPLSQ